MTARIESVLTNKNPSLVDENDWEEFTLTDVKVRVPGKSRYANLLFASHENPVSVTGQLEEVEESQKSLVLDDAYCSKRIIIEKVTHFAYGQHHDGEVGIWVAGEPGWFSIYPSRGYKTIYNDIVEAIDLLYFLIDKHRPKDKRRRQWNPKLEHLYDEYVIHTYGACEDEDEAADVFEKNHVFLAREMSKGKEGIDWSATPVYKHLRQNHEELFEELEGQNDAGHDVDMTDLESIEGENAETADVDAVEKSQADTIFEAILDLQESGRRITRQLTLKSAAEYLIKRYDMDSLEYAIDLLKARASHLIEMMDKARAESSIDWSRKTIYKQLKAAERSTVSQDVRNTPLHPRPSGDSEAQSSSSEMSDDEDLPRYGKRGQVSVLRPKLSTASAKRAGKGKQPASGSSESEEPDEMEIEETPSKPGPHRYLPKPLSARVKELAQSASVFSTPASPSPGTPSGAETNSLTNGESSVSQLAPAQPNVELPPDTWVCSITGCGKTVHKASSKRSKEVISDHALVHADDTQTKLSLVVAEQRLNINVSVDFLLNKIRDFQSV